MFYLLFKQIYVCLFGGKYILCDNCGKEIYFTNLKKADLYYCSNDCANSLVYNYK